MLYWQMCGFTFKFELNESILKQLIEHLFHEYIFYYYFTFNQYMVVQ